jgi:hypothetical protein
LGRSVSPVPFLARVSDFVLRLFQSAPAQYNVYRISSLVEEQTYLGCLVIHQNKFCFIVFPHAQVLQISVSTPLSLCFCSR